MTSATFIVASPVDTLEAAPRVVLAEQHGGRPRRIGMLLPVVPAVVMLCLGLVGLDRHSMWRDEAASLVAARRSLAELFSMLRATETVHAVYYTLLHGWLELGSGVVWARVPSVLAMAAAAGLVALLATRLASARVGLVAGLLFVANPSVSFYAQEARSTALVVAFALLSTWFLVRAVEGRRVWWAAYAFAGVLLVGMNLLAFCVLLAHAVTLGWWRHPRRTLRTWATAAAPALAVTLVLLAAAQRQPFQIGWIPRPGVASFRDLAHLTLGPAAVLVVLVGLLVAAALLPGARAEEARLRALALPLLVLPSAVLLAVSLVQPIFVPRYVFPSVAGAALLAALGVVRLGREVARRVPSTTRRRTTTLVAGLVVVVVAGAGLGAQRLERTPTSRPDDLAAAAAVVAAGARPGDAVLFLPDNRRLVALVHPAAFTGVRDVAAGASPEAADNLTGRPARLPVALAGLDASPRVWVVGRPGLALLPSESGSRAELDLLSRDFDDVDSPDVHGVGITLFVRRPGPR